MKKLLLASILALMLCGCGPPNYEAVGPAQPEKGVIQHKETQRGLRGAVYYKMSIYIPKTDQLFQLQVDSHAYEEAKLGDTIETVIINKYHKSEKK